MVETLYPFEEQEGLLLSPFWDPSEPDAVKIPQASGLLGSLLEELPRSSINVSEFAAENELTREQIVEMLSGADARRILESLAHEPGTEGRYLLALLLSVTPAQAMSEDLRERLGVWESDSGIQILPYNGTWWLCPSSETKLKSDMHDGKTVLVDDTLLVKDEGWMTGLCVRNFSTANGTFLKGSWYSPVDIGTRRAIEVALEKGPDIGRTDLILGTGQWAHMRDVSNIYAGRDFADFMERAEEYAFE